MSIVVLFFFFKQKTAYEMRISDCSSDVCSSDLMDLHGKTVGIVGTGQIGRAFARIMAGFGCRLLAFDQMADPECAALGLRYTDLTKIGRASCRERVCQYV